MEIGTQNGSKEVSDLVLVRPLIDFLPDSGFLSNQPIDQLSDLIIGARVKNNSEEVAENVTLSVEITVEGTSIYDETINIGAITPGSSEYLFLPESFDGYLTGYDDITYTLNISVISDLIESDTENNHFSTTFSTSGNTFSRWLVNDYFVGSTNIPGAEPGDFIGVPFFFNHNDKIYGLRAFIKITNGDSHPVTFIPTVYQVGGNGEVFSSTGTEYDLGIDPEGSWYTFIFDDITGSDLCFGDGYTYYAGLIYYFTNGSITGDTIMFGADSSGSPHNYPKESIYHSSAEDIWYPLNCTPLIELLTSEIDDCVWTDISVDTEVIVSICPNPTTGQFNITGIENATIKVFNLLGRQVMQEKNAGEQTVLDLSGFENGVYFVQIESEGDVVTKKVVLSK